jgi:hypothetical protein
MAQTLSVPIPGIHYFCDHRCWRCRLTDRCAVFGRWMTSEERQRAAKGGPTARVASALAVSLQVTMEDASVMLTSGAMAGLSVRNGSRPDAVSIPPDDRAERAMSDPLVVRGSDYTRRQLVGSARTARPFWCGAATRPRRTPLNDWKRCA